MKLAIIIVTWNSANEIAACLKSLKGVRVEHKTWVVDNNSSDETVEIVSSQFPDVTVIANSSNLGFAIANNRAIEETKSDYVLLLNPDTVVNDGSIEAALDEIESRPEVGLLSVRISNHDRSLQPSCFRFPTVWMNFAEQFRLYNLLPRKIRGEVFLSAFWDHSKARAVDWVLGAFMLVRRDVIGHAGSMPEHYFMYGEDTDWCYQVWKAGYQVWFTPAVSIVHYGNRSGRQLPSAWGLEKRDKSKYMFCEMAYGTLRVKLIVLTDLLAQTFMVALYKLKIWQDPTLRRKVLEGIQTSQKVAWSEIFRTRP